jgi:hypothetical protein
VPFIVIRSPARPEGRAGAGGEGAAGGRRVAVHARFGVIGAMNGQSTESVD